MEENWLPSTRYVGAMNITAARFRISEARHILATTDEDMERAERDMNKWLSELMQIEAKYDRSPRTPPIGLVFSSIGPIGRNICV